MSSLESLTPFSLSQNEAFDEEKAESTKKGPSSVHVYFSEECGMTRNFLHLQKFLEDTFPDLSGNISASDFPPLPTVLQEILPGVQLFAMALILFGDRVWTSMLRFRHVPLWYYPIKAHGIQCTVVLFFVIPKILDGFFVTGAFEIYVDDELAYSKLETGRLPTTEDVLVVFEKLGFVASKI